MMDSILLDLLQIAILIYSVVLHEVSHGVAARAMGDDTAERLGRLTLNPIAHLDMFGSFILPILTKLSGGFMFGYAKPVPYDPRKLNDRHWGPAKVAFAGPLMNFLLAAVFGTALRYFGPSLSPAALELVAYIIIINLSLAVFNLMPVPPLDGHWLLMAVLPKGAYGLKVAMYRSQFILLFIALFVVFPLLSPVIAYLFHVLTGVPFF